MPVGLAHRLRGETLASRATEGPRVPSSLAWRRLAATLSTLALIALAAPHALAAGEAPGAEAPAAAASPAPPAAYPPPADLHDLAGWLEYKAHNHVAALPHEARLFHRLGLLARESGQTDEAVRLVRGASELDPEFVAPHLTLASWYLLREPSQSLLQYATVLELGRLNFMLQLALAANAIYLGIQALFLGLLAAGVVILVVRVHSLRHPWEESLARWLSPETARWWSWAVLIVPFLAGLGPVLPTLFFLALLWPHLKFRERAVTCALALAVLTVPWTTLMLDRLSAPLDEERGPLFGTPLVEHAPWSYEAEGRLGALAASHPDNPYLRFALAWMQRRGGNAVAAEASYRKVLEQWPNDVRTLVNLGNTLAIQGRSDEALELYLKVTKLDPSDAPAWFNASQIYTQRFEYRPATDALARASALDFEMVKTYQSQATEDGLFPVVDQWIAPPTFWRAVTSAVRNGDGIRSLPPSWRGRIETTGWGFSAVALALFGFGLWLGMVRQRATPLRACSNCGRVVCRRCAQRRREVALCPTCAGLEAQAESPEFARVLLQQVRRKRLGREGIVRTAAALVLPGYGLLSHQRALSPVLILASSAALLSGQLGMAPPFTYEPRLEATDTALPMAVRIGLWAVIVLWSVFGYLRLEARARAQAAQLAAPVRSRVTQATRRVPRVEAA